MNEPDYSAQGPSDGFGPEDLLGCYARGVFPMADSRDDPRVFIIEPVLDGCAAAQGPEREDTWINAPIRRLYAALFAQGFVHSVECWKDERLAGGLYGVSVGGAFFGESMFSRERDASKVALVHLVARLRKGGWTLLDAQFLTDHLSQFGAVETPQAAYLRRLKPALKGTVDETVLIAPMTGAEAVDWALRPA